MMADDEDTDMEKQPRDKKGKGKEPVRSEGEPDDESQPGDDSDSDFDFYVPPPPQKPEWTVRGGWPSPCFDDHMEPFAGLDCEAGSKEWRKQMKALIKGNTLLVAISGKVVSESEPDFIYDGIKKALGRDQVQMSGRVISSTSAWMVFELGTESDVEKLLEKEHVYHPKSPLLLTFRRIERKPMSVRMLTVFQVPKNEIKEVEKSIIQVSPVPDESQIVDSKVVTRRNNEGPDTLDIYFTIKMPEAASITFIRPKRLNDRWRVRKGPHCTICRSDGHPRELCWWYGDLSDKGVEYEKKRLGQKQRTVDNSRTE